MILTDDAWSTWLKDSRKKLHRIVTVTLLHRRNFSFPSIQCVSVKSPTCNDGLLKRTRSRLQNMECAICGNARLLFLQERVRSVSMAILLFVHTCIRQFIFIRFYFSGCRCQYLQWFDWCNCSLCPDSSPLSNSRSETSVRKEAPAISVTMTEHTSDVNWTDTNFSSRN